MDFDPRCVLRCILVSFFFSLPLKFTKQEPGLVPVTRGGEVVMELEGTIGNSEIQREMAEFQIELDGAIDELKKYEHEFQARFWMSLLACAIGFVVVFLLLILYHYFHNQLVQHVQDNLEHVRTLLSLLKQMKETYHP